MTRLTGKIALFTATRDLQRETARQDAAFFIMAGIDLRAAMASKGEKRKRILLRIERLLERERLKGMRLHWSYDLDRHIALKRALDRLRTPDAPSARQPAPADRDRYKRKRRLPAPQ